ncbi:hypothetical protein ABPG75_002755 [Micractinium tetrahymenae]
MRPQPTLPRRQLHQAPTVPAPSPSPPAGEAPALISALLGIQGDFAATGSPSPGGPPPPAAPAAAAPPAGGGPPAGAPAPAPAGAVAASPGPGPCTDPSLLTQTMTTFCKLQSLDQLAALDQAAVQACCRLTSATLQRGCWDPCAPPPAVSTEVIGVLKLWRNICLVSSSVTCDEGPPGPAAGTPAPAAAPAVGGPAG